MQKDEENAKHGSVVREWTPDKIGDRFRDFAKVSFSRAGQYQGPYQTTEILLKITEMQSLSPGILNHFANPRFGLGKSQKSNTYP